jgi:secreted trypsin-like serine protease
VGEKTNQVEKYLPELFQPHLLCAGYPASSPGTCQGDSGGPLMAHNETLGQYFQVGIVSGGVSHCGNTDIPDYYVRLDYPEIAEFISDPEIYKFGNFLTLLIFKG